MKTLYRKPNVVYYNNIPAPYMVERFNAIVDHRTLHFEAWFNDRSHTDRSWTVDESSWRFPYKYIKTLTFAGKRLHFPICRLRNRLPDVIVSLYSEPSFLLSLSISRLKGVKIGFWAEVTFDRWVKRIAWKEAFKKIIFSHIDFVITAGNDGRNFAQRYGTPYQRIFFAPHSIDAQHYRDRSTLNGLERSLLRDELGVVGTTFIYVGRLVRKKGLDYLLKAFKHVQHRSSSEVSLLLVGDGADIQHYRHICKIDCLRNVVFTGFYQRNEIPRIYAAADVFVFPTLGDPYGLVVDEAMACSMPVISTSSVGEIHNRVRDDINGYIVPPGNSAALSEAMLKFVSDPCLIKRMGTISAKKIDGSTPEQWASDFERIVFSILNHPRRY